MGKGEFVLGSKVSYFKADNLKNNMIELDVGNTNKYFQLL